VANAALFCFLYGFAVAVFAWSQLQPCLLAIDAETCGTALRAYLPRMSSRLRSFWSTPALVTVGLARSARRRGRKAPPSPELSVKSRRLKHYGRRDILAAFGIANNEGHGHQLPSMQIIDRDVASQISVVEALPRFALNQDNGCFGIVHARTSRTLWGRCGPTPANEKKHTGSRSVGTTRGDPRPRSGFVRMFFSEDLCVPGRFFA
jgi:hypothetical protein